MKKIFYAGLALVGLLTGAASAQAQTISNLNFETWATRNGVEAPTNWQTSDDDYAAYYGAPSGTFNFGTISKTTDKHGGTYAAKLTTTAYTNTNGTFAIPGELILGAKTGVYAPYYLASGGSPLAARPTQLQCYYKLTGSAAQADSALALVYLTKSTNGTPTVLGLGYQYLAPTASYTQLSLPITYSASSTATPDSIHIIFTSGYATNITVGTALFVDDITVTGVNLAARADADVQEKLTVAPNPNTGGHFQLSAPDAPALASAPLTVLDMMGRVVAQRPALAVPTPTRELDLPGIATGIYVLRLDTKQGIIVKQLSIN